MYDTLQSTSSIQSSIHHIVFNTSYLHTDLLNSQLSTFTSQTLLVFPSSLSGNFDLFAFLLFQSNVSHHHEVDISIVQIRRLPKLSEEP